MWRDVSVDVGGMRCVYRIGRCVVSVPAESKEEADEVMAELYKDKMVVYVRQDNDKRQNCD